MAYLSATPTRLRVIVRELTAHAAALADHLETSGWPIHYRDSSVLWALRGLCSAGEPSELLEFHADVPDLLKLMAAVDRLNHQGAEFAAEFYFADGPALVCRRAKAPADPARPFQALLPLLDLLLPAARATPRGG